MRKAHMPAMCAVLLSVTAAALAQDNQATIMRPGDQPTQRVHTHLLDADLGQHTRLVLRPVVEPAATISRALSEQPVRTHLIEVQRGASRVHLDPYKNYINQGPNPIDANHFIPRSQSLWRNLHGNKAQMIRGGSRHESTASATPQPRFIIEIPRQFQAPVHPVHPIPQAPAPGGSADDLLARR